MNITYSGSDIKLQEKSTTVVLTPNEKVIIDASSATTIDWPGEYEVQGVTVRAFEGDTGLSILIGFDGVRFFTPANAALQLKEDDLEELGSFEILGIGAESSEWSAKEWKKFIEDIEPRIIIFYEDGEKTEKLRKELGAENVERIDKVEATVKNLPSDSVRFYMFST